MNFMQQTATTRLWLALLTAMAMLVALPGPARAAVYVVTYTGTGEDITYTKDGVADMTHSTLSSLVNTLPSGQYHTVNVGEGTYYLENTLTLKAGVKLTGAGADKTILDGKKERRVIECTDGAAIANDTVLSGFTIRNGKATNADGGGMYIRDGSPTVTDCTFTGNEAGDGNGGGMGIRHASTAVINCAFTNNKALRNTFGGGGGGMSITQTSITVANTTVRNCTFTGNEASQYGGGIYIHGNDGLTVTNCTFSANKVTETGSGHGGGGMYTNASMAVINCTFVNNTANAGTEVYLGGSSPRFINTLLWGAAPANVIGISGGASATCTNCAGPSGVSTGVGYVPISSWPSPAPLQRDRERRGAHGLPDR